MKREHLWFLVGGFAFGVLFGFGAFQVIGNRPDLAIGGAPASMGNARPAGPMAPTQTGPAGQAGAGGGGPMVAEINRLKGMLQEDPKDIVALVALGDLYYRAQMWDRAASYYERAIVERPDEPDLLTDLGVCYRGMREFDRAMEMFDRAHTIEPAHWQALFNKVVVAAFDLQDLDVALGALESIEAIQPRPENMDEAQLDRLREALEQAQQRIQSTDERS